MTATTTEPGHSGGSRDAPEILPDGPGGGNENESARERLGRLAYLILDDNRFGRTVIKNILHGFGIRNLIECESAKQALDLLRTARIDVIFADFEIPEMSGVEFTWRLRRAKDELVQRIPVIMVSTHADEGRVRLAINSGVNEYLPKPFAPADLYSRVERSVMTPKPFIVAPGYVGPDRRFADGKSKNGIERRGGMAMPAILLDFTGPVPRQVEIAKPGMAPPPVEVVAEAGAEPPAPPPQPPPQPESKPESKPEPSFSSVLSESDDGLAQAVRERVEKKRARAQKIVEKRRAAT